MIKGEGVRISDEVMRFGLLEGLLHHEEMSFQGAPNQVAIIMETKVEASLVDDDGCSREVFRCCSLKGEWGRRNK